jgi:hypothetical protein
MELASILLRILGDDALRTLATGGGDTCGLDCFLVFFVGCFLQFERPYLQILGFVGRVMPGLFYDLYLPPM